ncbi:hypothetical protein TNCV_2324591 [Trichonephila clavipes]|nr:hypothetical protein TNCV_2324591 [Trichonephila clavipes]
MRKYPDGPLYSSKRTAYSSLTPGCKTRFEPILEKALMLRHLVLLRHPDKVFVTTIKRRDTPVGRSSIRSFLRTCGPQST